MIHSPHKLYCATALLGALSAQGQDFPGPPWVESDYATSPDVFPSREFRLQRV
jgi:hypothetical protein